MSARRVIATSAGQGIVASTRRGNVATTALKLGLPALAAGAAISACSGGDPRSRALDSGNAAGSESSDAGSSGNEGSGAGGSGGETDAGSAGAGGASAVCGNGIVEDQENCEPEDFESLACSELGFTTGAVDCSADCSFDLTDCDGTELCHDGEDNDGDGDFDCEDEDCAADCVTSCGSVPELSDPYAGSGNNGGRASELKASCSPSDHGPEQVFAVTAAQTGMLDVTADGGNFPELVVSIREACEDDASELACGTHGASAAVTAGDRLYIVVQGVAEEHVGRFNLTVRSRPANACGDSRWDVEEECEDGNRSEGDGCDASCQLESSEISPNESMDEATPFDSPFYAAISPAGDVDWIAVAVQQSGAYMIANTYPIVVGSCGGFMDPFLELVDESGTTVAENDDYGSLCSRVVAKNLDAGQYYLVVKESPNQSGTRREFPYELGVTIDWCGNDSQGPLEGCDDGNTSDGDGCSATCQLE